MAKFKIICGDALKIAQENEIIMDNIVDLIFTSPSPPHSVAQGIGSEYIIRGNSEDNYCSRLSLLFKFLYPKLKNSGSLWVQIGDYHGERGSLRLTPEMLMLMMEREWILRNKIIWHRNEMNFCEENNRFMRDWEYLLFYTKMKEGYQFTFKSPSSSVFSVPYRKNPNDRYDSGFPMAMIDWVIEHTTKEGDIVLDPLCGAATTGLRALALKRKFIGIEIDKELADMAQERLSYE